jgi:hypothetical protein
MTRRGLALAASNAEGWVQHQRPMFVFPSGPGTRRITCRRRRAKQARATRRVHRADALGLRDMLDLLLALRTEDLVPVIGCTLVDVEVR